MSDIIIRQADFSDFEDILSLLKQLWPKNQFDFDTTKAVFNRNLKSDYKRIICAVQDSKIIGYCSMTIKNSLWQQGLLGNVDELVVDDKYRGKGIGKKLMDSITNIAEQIECKKIELDSGLHREDSHEFYKKLGFEIRAYIFSKTINKSAST
jgi:ribosomal protein S18 acetylase RimI-like enzyme